VAIDRSGRYLMLYPTSADQTGTRKAPQSVAWDTQTGVFTEMPVATHPYGHDSFGYGVSVNQDCCVSTTYDGVQWQFRHLSTPTVSADVLPIVLSPQEVYVEDHSTWNNARPDALVPYISGIFRRDGRARAEPDDLAVRPASDRRLVRRRPDTRVVLVRAASEHLARRTLGDVHVELGEDARN
jgi:hypothetical protein